MVGPAAALTGVGPAAALAARATAAPTASAVVIGDRRWSAAELVTDAAAAAGWLAPRLPGPRPRVAVCVADPGDQLVWALAGNWVGAAVAVLDVGWPPVQLAAAVAQLEPAVVVRHRPPAAACVSSSTLNQRGAGAGWIALTSGTSGVPRALRRTFESWSACYPAFSRLTGLSARDTVLVPGQLSSSMFAFAAFHALATGACIRLLPSWSLGSIGGPEVTAVHLVPTMLADLLEDPGRTGSRPRVVVSAGAPLPTELESRARAAWPGVRIVEYYGSTEQSFVAARVGGDPGTVGPPFPGVRVQIRDDAGRRLPPGVAGVIWTRSPYAAAGYVDGVPGRFRQTAGWVSVGDRGSLDDDGVLTLLGRDQITTGGATVDPAAVEAVLRGAPGVRDVVVLGVPHGRLGEVVAAVVEGRSDGGVGSLRRYAQAQLAAAQRPRRWYAVERLPLTGGGKPARVELLAAVQEGRLRPLS